MPRDPDVARKAKIYSGSDRCGLERGGNDEARLQHVAAPPRT